MTNWIKANQTCPCGKSDAYAIDESGNGYCFSTKHCGGKFFRLNEDKTQSVEEELPTEYKFIPLRSISAEVREFYGMAVKLMGDYPVETVYPYPSRWRKFRDLTKPKIKGNNIFRSEGSAKPELFGKDKFPPGSRESITIVEGEEDAAAVRQMLGDITASTSVRSSSSAVKDIEADWDYVNSFKKIYLCLDADEAGNNPVERIAGMFDFHKIHVVKMSRDLKDPNNYLEKDQISRFIKDWKAARKYTPKNVLSSFSDFEKVLLRRKLEPIVEYPFERLQKMLYGIHPGEVIVVKGFEGIGKTEFLRPMEYLALSQGIPTGIFHFEEDEGTAIRGLVTYRMKTPLNHPECIVPEGEIFENLKGLLKNDDSKLFIQSLLDDGGAQEFLDNIRYSVTVSKCKLIFFDHISWLATGNDMSEDERRKLDYISQSLKLMANKYRFGLVMISHVNDDGLTRGSRNITKVANTVISLNRDIKSPSEEERKKTYVTIEKARLLGSQTGPAGYLTLDMDTGMFIDPSSIKDKSITDRI